jgi:hypothetical protein
VPRELGAGAERLALAASNTQRTAGSSSSASSAVAISRIRAMSK